MGERIVNLDTSPRVAVTLQLAGQSFTIRRVVTGAQRLWVDFVRESAEYLEKIADYKKAVAELQNKPDRDEEISRRTEELAQGVDSFAEKKLDQLLGIIELLLKCNGYTFDRQWWLDNADEMDYRDFIIAAMLKDQTGAKKNTAAGGTSDGTA